MKYQLVLQSPHESLADHDSMIALEDQLIEPSGTRPLVDGHDWGSGEMITLSNNLAGRIGTEREPE
jgi:hypothetical protein